MHALQNASSAQTTTSTAPAPAPARAASSVGSLIGPLNPGSGSYKIGLASLTGSVEIYVPSGTKKPDVKVSSEREQPVFAVTIRMPTWLCYRAFESVVHRCQIGWMHYLRTRTIYPYMSPRWNHLEHLVRIDDVVSLQRELASADWTPDDCDDFGYTLLDVR